VKKFCIAVPCFFILFSLYCLMWIYRAHLLKSDNMKEILKILRKSRYLKHQVQDLNRIELNWIKLDDIPEHLIWLVIVSEDQRFYDHCGVDLFRIIKATNQTLSAKGPTIGASTLSQQMIKNLWGSPERNFLTKLHEMMGTCIVDYQIGKARVLELYFNVIVWGPGNPGLVYAVHRYLGKEVDELSIDDMIYLTAALPNPSVHIHRDSINRRFVNRVRRLKNKALETGIFNGGDLIYEK
jgi:monofunctional glycosyltransferase